MPMLMPERANPISAVVAAAPGWRVEAFAPPGTDVSGLPAPSHVVAWALVADVGEPGGQVVQPVFLAGARTWTPDQYRAAHGQALDVKVVPA
ncbi:hypothetical protein ACWGOK_36035 [Streptomyces eurythermus]